MSIKRLLTVLAGPKANYLPKNLITTEPTLIEGFENAADWTVANGAAAANTSEYLSGSQSLKITTNTGAVTCTATKDVTLDLSSSALNSDFRLYYFCHDLQPTTQNNGIYITLYSTTNLARYYQVVVYPVHYGWNVFHMRLTDWTQVGVDTWANARVKIRLSVLAKAGQVSTISFDRFEAGCVAKPAVLITFDDGGESIYNTAFGIMRPLGLVGTAYLITSTATMSDYMPLYMAGWDIASHSHNHTDFTTLTQAQIESELTTSKGVLDAAGYTKSSDHVAYPYGLGSADADTLAAMTATGTKTGRNVTTLGNSICNLPNYEMRILPGLNIGDPSVSLATAKGYIDTIIARQEMKVLIFHTLTTGTAGSTQWTVADFTELMAYIKANRVQSLTASEYYALHSGSVTVKHD